MEPKKIEEGTVGFLRFSPLFIRATLAGDPLRSHDPTDTLDFDRHARGYVLERRIRIVERKSQMFHRGANRENKVR